MTENNIQETKAQQPKLHRGVTFFFVWMGVFALTYGIFVLVDFLPEKIEDEEEVPAVEEATAVFDIPSTYIPAEVDPNPTVIFFDTLDKTVPILNPESSSVDVLDNALLSGAVRHPESADLENTGTMFILGHSSYLPTVHNKNFQAFNGIQKLEWGDTIRIQSDDMEYVYSVDRVYEAKASNATVPLQNEEAKLTLATCNSFGSKDDRFIVEAILVSKYTLD